jgi:hypothetical protein
MTSKTHSRISLTLVTVLLLNAPLYAQDRRSEVRALWNFDAGDVWIAGDTLIMQAPGYAPARFNLRDTSEWPRTMVEHPELIILVETINAMGVKELQLEAVTSEEYEAEADVDPLKCARAVSECLAAAAAYCGGIYALIMLCGGSLGITCVGIIIGHSILAGQVGFQCHEALEACGYGGKVGRDGKPVGQ